MACNCKKTSTPCGCKDQALRTPENCFTPAPTCPDPQPCAETFSDCCIIHTGDTIVESSIMQGDPLCVILQKLTLLITNAHCMDYASTCQSPVNFRVTSLYPTIVNLAWNQVPGADYYVVQWSTDNATWTSSSNIANSVNPSYTIPGVTPGVYYVRVGSVCVEAETTCQSVTLLINTTI